MQSKGAKIGFIILLIGFGIGAYWFYNYGPMAQMNNEAKKAYQNYVKTEATIISQESNGKIGKGAANIWTLQFKEQNGNLKTVTMTQTTALGVENGTKVMIYYDPANPNSAVSETDYDEITK